MMQRLLTPLAERYYALSYAAVAFIATSMTQALFVRLFGSSTPFWDEWVLLQLFGDYQAGTLTWQDMFAQHNEHRIFVGRAIFLLTFTLLGEWNPIINMIVSAGLVGCIAAIWMYTLIRLELPALCGWIGCIILVSPVQSENILWGFQPPYYTLLLAFVSSISLLSLCRRVTWLVVGFLIAAGFVYTFSLAIGLLLWGVVGMCLVLRLAAEYKPRWIIVWDRQAWALFGLFALAALLHIGFYVYQLQLGDGSDVRPKGVGRLVRWIVMALGFPIFADIEHSPLALTLAAAALWLPISTAIICHSYMFVRGATQSIHRLVFFVGIALFALCSAALLGYGRAGQLFFPSRYTTLYEWSSLLCLAALPDLFEQARQLRRWQGRTVQITVTILGALVLIATMRRVVNGTQAMADHPYFRRADTRVLTSFLNDPSIDRHIVGALGVWSYEYLENRLKQQRYRDLLPLALRTPQQHATAVQQEGDAWAPAVPLDIHLSHLEVLDRTLTADDWTMGGGIPLTSVSLREPSGWGSWRNTPERTGRIVIGPFPIVAPTLILPVVGRPTALGNTLTIEAADDPQRRIVFHGGNPPDYWTPWYVDVTPFVGRNVRIVASDGSTSPNDWFAFGWPKPETRGSRTVDLLLRSLDRGIVAATVVCVLLVIGTKVIRQMMSVECKDRLTKD